VYKKTREMERRRGVCWKKERDDGHVNPYPYMIGRGSEGTIYSEDKGIPVER